MPTEQEKPQPNSLEISSRSHASLTKWLAVMMAQAQARFPHYELPEVTKKLYLVDWLEMVREFGERRFQVGLERTLRRVRFFPQPAEIREWIPPQEFKGTYEKYEQPEETAELQAARQEFRDKLRKIANKMGEGKNAGVGQEVIAGADNRKPQADAKTVRTGPAAGGQDVG